MKTTAEGWALAQRMYDQQHPLWGSLRKPGEPPAPTMSEWIERVSRPATPIRELGPNGEVRPWVRRDVA